MENKENKQVEQKEQVSNSLPASANKTEAEKTFELMQRRAQPIAASNLIPTVFQNNIPNVMIALEVADRIGISPMMVMQNMYIVHGKPSWSSSFIIGLINQYSGFSQLRFVVEGEGDTLACYAACKDSDGFILKGPKVTYEMAKKEGWVSKSGIRYGIKQGYLKKTQN